MKITVKAHPRSKKSELKKLTENSYEIWFNVPAIEGRANERIVLMLAEHFKVGKTKVVLVSGHKAKIKTFSINK